MQPGEVEELELDDDDELGGLGLDEELPGPPGCCELDDDDDELDGRELELEPELCDERDEDDDREELGLLDELEPDRDELDELLDMNTPLSRAGTTEPYR